MGENMFMLIGIIGLGLIGGSLAKSIKAKTNHKVLAFDIDSETLNDAKTCGAVDGTLTTNNISDCNLIIIATAPAKALEWLKVNADKISDNAIVVDLCGVKRVICSELYARQLSFTFIGGHPMAGLERSGFANSRADLFDGASMILTPDPDNMPDSEILDELKTFFHDTGFASVIITTPEEHDRIIAYTSHLPHVVAGAFIKSPEASRQHGFSAGSFRDMTRVAGVDEKLWTELFLSNRDFLIEELEIFSANLNQYLTAIKANDSAKLESLLKEAREIKAHLGGKQ